MNYLKLLFLLIVCWCLQFNIVKAETFTNNYILTNLLNSGIDQVEQGALEESRQTFTKLINISPQLEDQIIKFKVTYNRLNQETKVIQSAYLHRGLVTYRLGDYLSALADFEVAKSIYPWRVEPYYNMGLAWSSKGEYTKAIAQYNLALTQISSQSRSEIADIYNDRGLAYLKLHNFAAAISDFNLGIRYHSKNSWLYYNLGCACHRYGDYAAAINNFSQALALDSQQGEAYVNRGLIHYHLGHMQMAFADLNAGASSFYRQGKMTDFQKVTELIEQMQSKISGIPSLDV
jgi:tetratricopeptide (TPR) repeat protein